MELLFSIPEDLKQQVLHGLVNFLVTQATQVVGKELSLPIRRLSSERAFLRAFDQALKRAVERFITEYTPIDEDLVADIAADPNFWQSPSVRNALLERVRRPGTWLQEQPQLTHHFADLFPQRINRERVDRAVLFLLRSLAEELWALPGAREVREVYSLQFQRLTAEAMREQVALVHQQVEALTTLSADLRADLRELIEQMVHQLLAAPSVPALPVRPRPYHNLPQPDYVRFVGREKELSWLRQRLSPRDRAWVLAITGIGGVGKSALALAIGHEYRQRYEELPPEERFEAIVWASAKERVLTPKGEEPAAPERRIFRTLADIYRAIAQALEREDITRAPAEEQDGVVQNALARQRTLLILDNMEGVTDEEVRAFLRNLPPPTKAIITSREWIEVADILRLMGMEREEAEALMVAEAEPRGLRWEEAQRRMLYERTAGLPLPIRLSVARLAGGERFEQVLHWLGNATGDLPQYCVGGQAELARQRNPHAWTVLLACALFDRQAGASREALGAVADLSLADRDDGLTLLQRLNLLNRSGDDRFWMLPIVQEYARAQLTAEGMEPELRKRWVHWYQNLLADKSAPYEARQVELPNVIAVLDWLAAGGPEEEKGLAEKLAELVERSAILLHAEGEWDKLVYYAREVVQLSRSTQAPHLIGGFTGLYLASIWAHRNKPEDIGAVLKEAESILRQDPAGEPALLMLQTRVARYAMRLDQAIEFLKEALEKLTARRIPEYQIAVQNSLGLLLCNAGKWEEAERTFSDGSSLLESFWDEISDAYEWEAKLKGNIAIIKGKQGYYQEAYDQVGTILPYLTNKLDKAEARIFLANWQYHLGNIGAAREFFAQAEELLRKLQSEPPSIAQQEYEELRRIFASD